MVVNAPSRNVYYGNLVAGPIFKEVADKVYAGSVSIHAELANKDGEAHSKIPYAKDGFYSDLSTVYDELGIKTKTSQKVNDWVKVSTGKEDVQVYHKKIAPIYIPDVTGLSVKDAIFILENQGLIVKFIGSGTVKKQSISPGEKIIKGSKILLELV